MAELQIVRRTRKGSALVKSRFEQPKKTKQQARRDAALLRTKTSRGHKAKRIGSKKWVQQIGPRTYRVTVY